MILLFSLFFVFVFYFIPSCFSLFFPPLSVFLLPFSHSTFRPSSECSCYGLILYTYMLDQTSKQSEVKKKKRFSWCRQAYTFLRDFVSQAIVSSYKYMIVSPIASPPASLLSASTTRFSRSGSVSEKKKKSTHGKTIKKKQPAKINWKDCWNSDQITKLLEKRKIKKTSDCAQYDFQKKKCTTSKSWKYSKKKKRQDT